MVKFKFFELSFVGALERFYLMMVGTIILGFLNQFFLATIWAFILAVSFILGVSTQIGKEKVIEKGKIIPMGEGRKIEKTA